MKHLYKILSAFLAISSLLLLGIISFVVFSHPPEETEVPRLASILMLNISMFLGSIAFSLLSRLSVKS